MTPTTRIRLLRLTATPLRLTIIRKGAYTISQRLPDHHWRVSEFIEDAAALQLASTRARQEWLDQTRFLLEAQRGIDQLPDNAPAW